MRLLRCDLGARVPRNNPEGEEELRTPYLTADNLDLTAWSRDAVCLALLTRSLPRGLRGPLPIGGRSERGAHEQTRSARTPPLSALESLPKSCSSPERAPLGRTRAWQARPWPSYYCFEGARIRKTVLPGPSRYLVGSTRNDDVGCGRKRAFSGIRLDCLRSMVRPRRNFKARRDKRRRTHDDRRA